MARWLLQWNPNRWEPGGQPITNWKVSRYLDELQPGEVVVLWRGGKDPGICGIYRTTGPVEKVQEPKNQEEIDLNVRYWLPIQEIRRFFIPKADLVTDPRFADHDIVNNPRHRQPNPFRLTDEQWEAIAHRMVG